MQLGLKIDGARVKECRWPLEAGKGKEIHSPSELLEGAHPCSHVDLRASDLLNYKTANTYCFKPMSLWLFVTAAIGN